MTEQVFAVNSVDETGWAPQPVGPGTATTEHEANRCLLLDRRIATVPTTRSSDLHDSAVEPGEHQGRGR